MKYLIKPLESFCIDYLLDTFNAENVFTVLQFCLNCQTDSQLMYGCKEFIRSKTETVLKAESFPKISHQCLVFLLEQDFLCIDEVHLFQAVCFFIIFSNSKELLIIIKFLVNL